MQRGGRRPAWTHEQREQVLALAAEGTSQRDIAALVFGDVRYRGRVERILRALPRRQDVREPAPCRPDAAPALEDGLGHEAPTMTDFLASLVVRQWRELAASGVLPPLGDIERLLRIDQRLQARQELEELQELTREQVTEP